MIKGIMYSIIMALIILCCIIGEITYRYKLRKFKREYPRLNVEMCFACNRVDCYLLSVLWICISLLIITVISGMISTWNDPL